MNLYTTCPTCDGSGHLADDYPARAPDDCPNCAGLGLVPISTQILSPVYGDAMLKEVVGHVDASAITITVTCPCGQATTAPLHAERTCPQCGRAAKVRYNLFLGGATIWHSRRPMTDPQPPARRTSPR